MTGLEIVQGSNKRRANRLIYALILAWQTETPLSWYNSHWYCVLCANWRVGHFFKRLVGSIHHPFSRQTECFIYSVLVLEETGNSSLWSSFESISLVYITHLVTAHLNSLSLLNLKMGEKNLLVCKLDLNQGKRWENWYVQEEGRRKALLGPIYVFITLAIIRLLFLLNTSKGNTDLNKDERLSFYQTNCTKQNKAQSEILVYFGFPQKGNKEEK